MSTGEHGSGRATSPPQRRSEIIYKNTEVPQPLSKCLLVITIDFAPSDLTIDFHHCSHSVTRFCTNNAPFVGIFYALLHALCTPQASWRRQQPIPSPACCKAHTRALMLQLSLGEIFFFPFANRMQRFVIYIWGSILLDSLCLQAS